MKLIIAFKLDMCLNFWLSQSQENQKINIFLKKKIFYRNIFLFKSINKSFYKEISLIQYTEQNITCLEW